MYDMMLEGEDILNRYVSFYRMYLSEVFISGTRTKQLNIGSLSLPHHIYSGDRWITQRRHFDIGHRTFSS